MPEFLAHVLDGKIVNALDARRIFSQLKDGHYIVRITSKKPRSLGQNAYFHGVVLPILFEGFRAAGFDDVDDHETAKQAVKNLFAKKWISGTGGLGVEIIQPTSRMTTVEFQEFIDKVIKFGAEYLNVQIPYPNEYLKDWGLEK